MSRVLWLVLLLLILRQHLIRKLCMDWNFLWIPGINLVCFMSSKLVTQLTMLPKFRCPVKMPPGPTDSDFYVLNLGKCFPIVPQWCCPTL